MEAVCYTFVAGATSKVPISRYQIEIWELCYAFVVGVTFRVLIPSYWLLGPATSMPTWIWLLHGYYMDMDKLYACSKLEPNYMEMDLFNGFYLVIMYFIINYMSFNLLYRFYSVTMDFITHALWKKLFYLKYSCVSLFPFLYAHWILYSLS